MWGSSERLCALVALSRARASPRTFQLPAFTHRMPPKAARPWTAPRSGEIALVKSQPTAFAQALSSSQVTMKKSSAAYMSVAEALKELSDNQAKSKAKAAMRPTVAAPPDWGVLQRREEANRTRWLSKQHDQQRKKWGRLAPPKPMELSRPSSSSSTGRGLPTFGLAGCEKGIWRREGQWGGKGRDGTGWAWNGIEYYDRRSLDRPRAAAAAWLVSATESMPQLEPLRLRSSEVEAALWAVFQAADADGSGSISKRELYRAIEQAASPDRHTRRARARAVLAAFAALAALLCLWHLSCRAPASAATRAPRAPAPAAAALRHRRRGLR